MNRQEYNDYENLLSDLWFKDRSSTYVQVVETAKAFELQKANQLKEKEMRQQAREHKKTIEALLGLKVEIENLAKVISEGRS